MSREELLRDLIGFRRPVADVRLALGGFPWDSDELVTLTRANATDVLDRYLDGELSAGDLEAWADALELRDDVGFERESAPELGQLVFELANPLLASPITADMARVWRTRLT